MANNLIAEISRLGLKDLNTLASALITDVRHLVSYNWIKALRATPTIADTGHIYIAQNAARYLDSSLELLFRALYVSHPSFNIASINVVTDWNNIHFTIHVELTNNTAIFCREETKTDEYISPNEFRGYSHSFEKKYTSCQVSRSTRHHRIISYSFGGLKFIVCYEMDGYISVAGTQLSLQPAGNQAPEVDDLSSILDSLSLSPESMVPLPSTLEVKTRVVHRPLAFEDVVSQLWVLQTLRLVRTYHTKGVFAVPKVEDVAVQVKAWEDQNQKDLRMLAGLIGKIRDIVRESGGRAILKYDANGANLVFHKLGGKQMLPKGLYAKWEGSDEQGSKVAHGSFADNLSRGSSVITVPHSGARHMDITAFC
ncbi:hypothetical protein K469DRAFT_732233 [Zopfia rhizophila CBS 207.26]|uniref:Geranylgeranyl pyrophosphate synthetase n=1 Tax=Zopfia rhizophila CBS 207.26 TaxID=1314779 RepID=A0A6A6DF84_9PEZI|nr:hypothetical protein K469DRAFT_732233 [Zopfia rhizophila CBS 207.26]